MLFRDIRLNYVDVETLRNLIKYTAVEKWAIENQHIKNFIIYFFKYILNFIYFVNSFFFDFGKWNNLISRNAGSEFKGYGK